MGKKKPEGLRFQCQGSGKCCVSRGGYGFVYFSLKDRRRMALHLGISTRTFTRQYCAKTEGFFHLKSLDGPCVFLEGKQCAAYEARPTQCRTWPFWAENMKAKAWAKEVAAFCPGVGKGPVVSPEDIARQIKMDSWTR